MASSKSFSNRLSMNVVFVVSGVFLLALLVVGITSHKIIAVESTRAVQHILHGTISDIELPLTTVEVSTKVVAAHVEHYGTNERALEELTRSTVANSSLITGCGIIYLNHDGPALYSYLNPEDSTIQSIALDDQIYQFCYEMCVEPVLDGHKACWIDPYVKVTFDSASGQFTSDASATSKNKFVTYCHPLFDGDSDIYAIVTADISAERIEKKVTSLRPYPNSFTSILCKNSIIGIDDSAVLANMKKQMAQNKDLAAINEDMRKGKDSIRRFFIGSALSFVVYGPLHNGWEMAIVCSYKDVLAQVSVMHVNLLVIGVLGLIFLFFSCRRTIRRLTRPITELSVSALNMAKGNFHAQLPEIKSQDEMLRLRDSFAYLQTSIADYIDELKHTTQANERMESELNVARNIQMGMLRTDFTPQLHALLTPAKEVGGDLYDFVQNGDTLYFAIGDVSGKGVPASLTMAITRAALHFVAGLNLDMAQTMSRVNNSVSETNSDNMFVTLFVGKLNLSSRHLEYCNAGHNPIIIIPPDGEPYFLKAKANIAVGLFEDYPYEAEQLDLKAGTRIVAYTDGVCEAEKADKSLFGNERLLQWAGGKTARSMNSTEQEVVEELYGQVQQFADGNPQNDDITILSLRVE